MLKGKRPYQARNVVWDFFYAIILGGSILTHFYLFWDLRFFA